MPPLSQRNKSLYMIEAKISQRKVDKSMDIPTDFFLIYSLVQCWTVWNREEEIGPRFYSAGGGGWTSTSPLHSFPGTTDVRSDPQFHYLTTILQKRTKISEEINSSSQSWKMRKGIFV